MTVYLDDLTRLVRTKVIECECGCWYWTGGTDTSGYAKFKLRGRIVAVHRYSYERLVGEIPDDLTVDHLHCTSRRCINPDHMQLVTRSENSTRANATKWHDEKFTAEGEAVARVKCLSCVRRESTASMGALGRVPEPADWYDSDAVDQPL